MISPSDDTVLENIRPDVELKAMDTGRSLEKMVSSLDSMVTDE